FHDHPDRDGWSNIRSFDYQTSPDEKREVEVGVRKANGAWLVVIYDLPSAVGEKRSGQVSVIFSRLFPKGYERESFAGKKAHRLDEKRIAALKAFVEKGIKELGVPGVSFGLLQKGKLVFAGGFGARVLGDKDPPTADTLYMIASNTKALTTLMLAK